jgi:hypothetical protein
MYPKPPKKEKKNKPLKKISDKRRERLKNWWGEKDLFLEVWNEREHKCNECWKYLKEAKAHNFSHIRSKGARPDLRLDKSNIEILCFACHFLKDHWLKYKWPDLD